MNNKPNFKAKKPQLVIGLDIGGTKIRGVLMAGNKILKKAERKYSNKPNTKIFQETLFKVLDSLYKKEVKKIGIGIAGVVANNQVIAAGNLKVSIGFDFEKIIKNKYQTEVFLTNDVNASLFYELKNLKNISSVFMLTLGTGVGGAYYADNRINKGSFDSAYEIGMMILDNYNLLNVEQFCSEKFFKNKKVDPLQSEILARGKNKNHQKLWQEFGKNLGIVIGNLSNLLEPELFLIGGGLSHAWPLFISNTKKTARDLILSPYARKNLKIRKQQNVKFAGAIGAGYFIEDKE
jgi:glucokinase